MSDYCVIYSTTPSREEALKIANALLKAKLAACVQITGITSVYEWKDKINCDEEKLLIIKTKDSLYKDVEKEIVKLHSYEVPEILKTPVVDGLPEYLGWISSICS